MIPVFLVACFARIVLKMNFITLTGWIAGAMTSSSALLFADETGRFRRPRRRLRRRRPFGHAGSHPLRSFWHHGRMTHLEITPND